MSTAEPPRIYPTFRYRDAAAMIGWLQDAFGLTVRVRYMDGDTVAHAELALGSAMIMVGSVRDDAYGAMVGAPAAATGGKSIYVAVEDADAVYARAKTAGATILEEPVDRGHGSREFICADPEGNVWSFGTYWPKAGDEG